MEYEESRPTPEEASSPAASPLAASSRVLGELLATPALLLSLPSVARLAEVVARAMSYVPGVSACRVCLVGGSAQTEGFEEPICADCRGARGFDSAALDSKAECSMSGRQDTYVFKHRTPSGLFGFTTCVLSSREAFAPYEPFVANLGNFVALVLENRVRQESLEETVARRTLALQELNAELRREIEERERQSAERRRAEEGLRKAQKMEAFGQLAGGVAHDFNNLLTVIQGNIALARLTGKLAPEQALALDEIAESSTRAANLTRQLLMFSRQKAVQMRDLDMNEIVGNMTKMLKRLIGEHITLVARHSSGTVRIHADPGMMEQVLMNLSVNSRDAMPKGGELTIETEVVHVERPEELSPRARAGAFVRLRVSDTGMGIAVEHQARIFEPFFTTKGVGKGTGLGLATVFGIVEQHRGWIDFESAPGQGATFRIYLPQVSAAGGPESGARSEIQARGGKETILLVEDESQVRALARRILTAKGYRVIEAASGAEALEVWRKHGEGIDLLLTDMVMPGGMSGRELGKTLQADRPALRIIYCSGYTDEMLGDDSQLRDERNFLEKPYDTTRLLKAVRECLDAARPR